MRRFDSFFMFQSARYIAFKVKGDTFWYLLDIKEGKFKNDGAWVWVRAFVGRHYYMF